MTVSKDALENLKNTKEYIKKDSNGHFVSTSENSEFKPNYKR